MTQTDQEPSMKYFAELLVTVFPDPKDRSVNEPMLLLPGSKVKSIFKDLVPEMILTVQNSVRDFINN